LFAKRFDHFSFFDDLNHNDVDCAISIFHVQPPILELETAMESSGAVHPNDMTLMMTNS
jgi:hypothetical protein